MTRTDETIEALADSIVSLKLDRNTIVQSLHGLVRVAIENTNSERVIAANNDFQRVVEIFQRSKAK